ncbi:MAG: alpha/beta hydrolase [Tetrasphaera sp.]|nr:alpha/beta hydrolase [Tetrasphaera sp.]
MSPTTSTYTSETDGTVVTAYSWGGELPDRRGVVQIAHGLGEHGARYDRLARALVDAGYAVHASDHRGHGATAQGRFGEFGVAGFDGLVADVVQLGREVRGLHPGLPLALFAHSMGSFAAQRALLDHSSVWDAVVLSGSTALDVLAANLASAGDSGAAGLEAFNAGFEHRTGFEWLSRDEAEVDAYCADPWCGFDTPPELIGALFGGAARMADPEALRGIRPDLPVLLASGTDDPLAGGGQLVELVGARYREAGLRDVTVTLYPGARHEIVNETNRDEVTADVIGWLGAHLPA